MIGLRVERLRIVPYPINEIRKIDFLVGGTSENVLSSSDTVP